MSSSDDPFAQFKAKQKEAWGLFAPVAAFTTPPAASLVNFAGVSKGQQVLDVACGTGVVAVTAARRGATVKGLDLAPALLDVARQNAALSGIDIEFTEGDVEQLPYDDASFDVVLSQFGHMFAPRPVIAVSEMLRVLKPGGRIAFSTWPPELMIGLMFRLASQHVKAPEGAAPPPAWGNPDIVRDRLGEAVRDLQFTYGEMQIPTLSPQHYRANMEQNAAPVMKAVEALQDRPDALATFRKELENIVARFFSDNVVRQNFLMSRAIKVG